MRKKKLNNINEEINHMKRLMGFDIKENSHDVLSEQDYGWMSSGNKSKKTSGYKRLKISSLDFNKPSTPKENWMDFLSGDKKMVKLMGDTSKTKWVNLKGNEDFTDFAVYALERFNSTDKIYGWNSVIVKDSSSKEETEETIPDEEKQDIALPLTFPFTKKPSAPFFVDNNYETTDVFKQSVNEDIINPLKSLDIEESTNRSKFYLNSIKISTSASRFRNTESPDGKTYTFEELSKLRNDAAKNYIFNELKSIGCLIDGDTKIDQIWQGGNGDGTTGPNPPIGFNYSENGKEVINPKKEGSPKRNKYGEPHADKKDYEKYKYLKVEMVITILRPEKEPEEKPTDEKETEEIKSGEYVIVFTNSTPGSTKKQKNQWFKKIMGSNVTKLPKNFGKPVVYKCSK